MSYKMQSVILSGVGEVRELVKLSGDFEGGRVKIEFSPTRAYRNSVLYVIGKEIAKFEVYGSIIKQLTTFYVDKDIVCVLIAEGVTLVGSTGKTPRIRAVCDQIDEWEKANHKNEINAQSPDGTYKIEHSNIVNNDNSPLQESAINDTQAEQIPEPVIFTPAVEYPESDKQQFKEYGAKQEHLDYGAERGHLFSTDEKVYASATSVLDRGVRYDGTNFYLAIKPQLDEMFICYPEEMLLNEIVPNSKWVHVDTEDGYYVVGVLFDGSAATYICYGIPSEFSKQPPPEIADVCVWLPLDLANREGNGYWVIYQSAIDGKCVR